jgi:RimJ/RimL family protein N-acetyltransferase
VVAVKKDMIVGFAYLAVPKFYNPIAYIGIAVAKSERRGNVGSMLFYEVASWAATQHLQYIIADIWEWNVGSKKFFKSLGFEEKERFEQKFEGKDKEKIRMVRKM